MQRIMDIFHATAGTSEGIELDRLLILVKDYEDRDYVISDTPTKN